MLFTIAKQFLLFSIHIPHLTRSYEFWCGALTHSTWYTLCYSLYSAVNLSLLFPVFCYNRPLSPWGSLKFHPLFTHSEAGPWSNDQAKINTCEGAFFRCCSLCLHQRSFTTHSRAVHADCRLCLIPRRPVWLQSRLEKEVFVFFWSNKKVENTKWNILYSSIKRSPIPQTLEGLDCVYMVISLLRGWTGSWGARAGCWCCRCRPRGRRTGWPGWGTAARARAALRPAWWAGTHTAGSHRHHHLHHHHCWCCCCSRPGAEEGTRRHL